MIYLLSDMRVVRVFLLAVAIVSGVAFAFRLGFDMAVPFDPTPGI